MRLIGNRTFGLALFFGITGFILALLHSLTGDYTAIATVCTASYAGKSAYTAGKGGTVAAPEPGA